MAGVSLFMLGMDGELGPHCFSIAAKKDRARQVFQPAANMVPETELAKAGYQVFKERITYRFGFYQVLSSDATTSSGHKTHFYVGDETHEHKSPYLVERMIGGMSARGNPLGWQITTAGVDKQHFCYKEYREDIVRILTRKADLDHIFGIINIDVSTDIERLRERCQEAQNSSLRKQIFLNEHLNIWGSEETGHFKAADWDACYDPNLSEADLVGKRCAGIFDLSQTRDMSALVYLFHPEKPTNPDNPKAGGRWIVGLPLPAISCPKNGTGVTTRHGNSGSARGTSSSARGERSGSKMCLRKS